MLSAGTRLGPYEIHSPLGAGGMGEVYRARDTRLGRDVAVKVLPDLFAGDPERMARFEREAQMLAALSHPNIATIFGLAKVFEGTPTGTGISDSPTLSLAATQAGVIVGTAADMSPEQAKGKPADKRSDVWSFGCVLYEMLTGKRPFDGEDVSDTLAMVLRGEPAWDALPGDLTPQLQTLVKRCLAKDRKHRIPDISVARFLMTETIAPPPAPVVATPPPMPVAPPKKRTAFIAASALLAGAALAGAAAWAVIHWTPPPKLQPMRFAIVPPPRSRLAGRR